MKDMKKDYTEEIQKEAEKFANAEACPVIRSMYDLELQKKGQGDENL